MPTAKAACRANNREGAVLSEAAKQLLESDALAHIATLDGDGRPYVTLAWVGIQGDDIVFATLPDQRKLRNLRRDPRVTVSIQTDRRNEIGLTEYLVVYGIAAVTEGGAPELLQELAHTYLGPGVRFPPMPNPPPGYVTRIRPQRLGGLGPWEP
jgi:PPOX class probable F420-dependent enzyme